MSQQPPSGPPPPPPGAGRGDDRPAWGDDRPTWGDGGAQRPAWEEAPPRGGADRPSGQNGPAIAALVCGVLGLVFFLVPVLGLLLAVVALVLGIVGLRRTRDPATAGRGLAIAGIVTGALGTLIGLWWLIGLVGLFTDEEFQDLLERVQEGEDPEEVIEDLDEGQFDDGGDGG